MLCSLGPHARFDAIDQEDAFRADHINLEDAHLYCYLVGQEWFVDLRDPFGNIKSEYTYAVVVAVLKFGFECDRSLVDHGSRLLGYVDNWFLLSKANCHSHDRRWENLKAKFKLLGAPMHEEQRSTDGIVNALGGIGISALDVFHVQRTSIKIVFGCRLNGQIGLLSIVCSLL
jgi:hypothetical protein